MKTFTIVLWHYALRLQVARTRDHVTSAIKLFKIRPSRPTLLNQVSIRFIKDLRYSQQEVIS